MAQHEAAVALRHAIDAYAQASVNHALSARSGYDIVRDTEKHMLDARVAVEAAIDATALTLAADMLAGLRQIRNMIDAPQFDEDRKCRVRKVASDLIHRAETLHIDDKSLGEGF